MINLYPYSDVHSKPKYNAQHNLNWRTFYVDDASLQFHNSRIVIAQAAGNGALFALVTNDATTLSGAVREYRFVIFDLVGNVIASSELGHGYRTRRQALAAMRDAVNTIDVVQTLNNTVVALHANHKHNLEEVRKLIKTLHN